MNRDPYLMIDHADEIIIGKKSLTSIKKGTALKLEHIENFSNDY